MCVSKGMRRVAYHVRGSCKVALTWIVALGELVLDEVRIAALSCCCRPRAEKRRAIRSIRLGHFPVGDGLAGDLVAEVQHPRD